MGAAVGPVFLTPLTEMSGRLPITHVAHVLFVVAAAIGGGSVNTAMLIVARFFMGVASAVPCTVGGGFIADLIPVEKRGTAMTIWSVGLLLVCPPFLIPTYNTKRFTNSRLFTGIGNWYVTVQWYFPDAILTLTFRSYFRGLHGHDHWMEMDYLA